VLYDTDIDPSQVSAAHLQNIIARLAGTNSTGTVGPSVERRCRLPRSP
jgi:hypothetical protein